MNNAHSRLLSMVVVGIALATSASGCGNGSPLPAKDSETATWSYWQSMNAIAADLQASLQRLLPADTPDEERAASRKSVGIIRKAASEIGGLDVLNVDQELIDYAVEVMSSLNQWATFNEQSVNIRDDAEAIKARAGSFSTMLEAVFRSMGGDPMGTYGDVKSSVDGLKQRAEQAMPEAYLLQQRLMRLESTEVGLRAVLSRRYNKEFPRLAPGH